MRVEADDLRVRQVAVQPLSARLTHAAFTEKIVDLFDGTPLNDPQHQKSYDFHIWNTDQCCLMQTDTMPFSLQKTARHASLGGHLIVMHRYLTGGWKGLVKNEVLEREPGAIYLLDQELPLQAIEARSTVQIIYFSKAMLGFHPDDHPRALKIDQSSFIGKCVHTEWDGLFDRLLVGDLTLCANAIERFFACIKIALGTNPRRGDVRAHARDALFSQICQFIERNLTDADMSAGTILQNFGLSRASLYRMFESKGGVRSYITERRALRAVLDIAQRSTQRGIIQAVSDHWGFSTRPAFNRTVNRLFGNSPGKLFRNVIQAEPYADLTQRFKLQFPDSPSAAMSKPGASF